MPGWTFTITEVSIGVYRVNGWHKDGRSVSRAGFEPDIDTLLLECKADASALPDRPHDYEP